MKIRLQYDYEAGFWYESDSPRTGELEVADEIVTEWRGLRKRLEEIEGHFHALEEAEDARRRAEVERRADIMMKRWEG